MDQLNHKIIEESCARRSGLLPGVAPGNRSSREASS